MADFTPIRVSELPEVTNVGENDYLVVDDGIQTSKIKSKNYNARSSGSAKEYADEAARSASRATERAEAAAQSVIQVDALAQNASTSANHALDYSRDAEAWAKGTRGGSAVPITDATHENNAKYFAQQAHNSATSAAESADAAEELLVSAIDSTLTQAGKAADAKKTGDELANLSSAIDVDEMQLWTADIKTSLLACFQNVAWATEQGGQYVSALEAALYASEYPKLSVVYTPGVTPVYADDTLDTVKQYLTVTYYAEQGSAGVIVPSADYVLTGTLQVGTSTLTASYSGAKAPVIIPNVVDYYNVWEWSTPATLQIKVASPGVYNNVCGYDANPLNIRRSAWGYRGLHGVYNNTAGAVDDTTYPIPIPQGATKMVIACSNIGNLYAGVSQWKYNPSTGVYTRNVNGAWTAIAGTEFAINRTASDFATIIFKISSGTGEVFPSDPVVTVTFSE